jgi:putative ABC transport system permease protein
VSSRNKISQPPKRPMKLLRLFIKDEYLEEIEGDMEEIYQDLLEKFSPKKADRIYFIETIKLFRLILFKRLSGTQKLNYYGMFKLMLKTSIRNVYKHKLVATMSLITLVFGAVCFQLVYAWIQNEQTMDKIHSKADRIHIAVARFNPKGELSAIPLQRIFNLDYGQFPSVEKVLVSHTYGSDEIKFIARDVVFGGKALIVDSTFFGFFDFKLLRGAKHVLKDPSHVVITKDFAERVFGSEDPMGKTIEIKCDQTGLYQVAGIIEKIPSNSSIDFDFLVPRHSKEFWRRMPQELLLVDQHFDRKAFNQQIEKMGQSNVRFPESILTTVPFTTIYKEHPFHISLFSKYGDKTNLQTMRIVAIVILLITIISFVNLQTTLQLTMVGKMGIKKVIGATRFDLGLEIFLNRLMYLLVAVLMSFLLYQWVFPFYVIIMELNLDSSPLFDLQVMLSVIGIIVFISMMASLTKMYHVRAITALSSKLSFLKIPQAQRVLTTIQYAFTAILLVATTVIFLQLRYLLNKDTGLAQNNIIKTDFFEIMPNERQDSITREKMIGQHQYVINQLQQNPNILAFSQGSMPINVVSTNSWKLVGSTDDHISQNTMSVDPFYDELFGLQMADGRFFSDSLDNNDDLKLVINEAAKKYWDIDDINKVKLNTNTRGSDARNRNYSIIGVVKNYHYQHLSQNIKPLVLSYFTYRDSEILIRFKEGTEYETIEFLDKLFREVNPGGIFTLEYIQDQIEQQYAKEKRMSKINLTFSVVALLLAIIGLFTFAFHETKRRTKEIGIRKVNGANVTQVFVILSTSFLKSIMLAFIIACPLAWYLMKTWLENFANRVAISWWIFAFVGIVISFISLMTISWQTLKVARMNPADSLRSE